MRARLIVINWLVVLVIAGCNGASSRVDVGPCYTAPAGTESQKIDGVVYAYAAPVERQERIVAGFSRLKVGQRREEVRELLGEPDSGMAMHRRGSDRFEGWHYVYYIRTRYNWTDANDQWAEVFFDASEERLYFAHANAMSGLADVGAQRE